MSDNCLPKQIFYGELVAEAGLQARQKRQFKDAMKTTLKECNVAHDSWEALLQGWNVSQRVKSEKTQIQ